MRSVLPRRVSGNAISRRQALRQIGSVAGATALMPWLIGCGDDCNSAPATAGTLQPEELDIETVVIVMMENRSFDHYFGSLSLEEGRAVDGLKAAFSNLRDDGSSVSPFPLTPRCVADPPHSWDRSRAQVNGGANDGFVRQHFETLAELPEDLRRATADQVMGYQRRTDLPILYTLADEFALCQRWFCSVLGPTWPNRMYLHSAQSNGRMTNAIPELPGFTWPTIYDRLSDAGIEWKSYWGDLPFLWLWGHHREQMDRFANITQFIDDARSGVLPPVVQIDPAYVGQFAFDDHPPHDIKRGQAFLSSIFHALAEGPQWSRSMVILTFDEHGGFFDHVAPPTVEDERSDEGFGQLGVRVPGLVISPYTQRGFVSSTLYEHSSVPAFLEWLFGLEPLTVRDANANYFLDTFDVGRVRRHDPRPMPTLPVITIDPDEIPEECAPEAPSGGDELAAYADAGGIPAALDGRGQTHAVMRTITRELIRMGGARVK